MELAMKLKFSRRKFILSATSLAPAVFARAQPKGGGLLSFLANEPQGAKPLKSDWKNAGVIDLSNSPYAKLKTVPVRAVTIQNGFWSQRRKTNLVASIPSMHDELLEHGRMDNFLRLERKASEPQKGPVYSDSDIYKWAEAVGVQLHVADNPWFRQATDAMIREGVSIPNAKWYR